jgi:hypothetical protein
MRIIRGRLAILTLVLVVGAAAAAPVGEEHALRYKFKEGEKLRYTLEQKMTMDMSVLGNDVKMEMNQTMETTWHITAVDKDGKARMTQTIDRIRMTMDGPTGKIEFDSKESKEGDDPISKVLIPILKGMVGGEITMTMDSRGQFSDVKLSEKYAKALKNMPAGGGLGGDFMSEDGIKRLITQSAMTLPEGGVTKGKSWSSKHDAKMGQLGKMVVDTRYAYEGMETRRDKKVYKISMKPTVSIEADPGAPVAIKLKSQDTKGSAYFDNEAGRLLDTDMVQNLEMELDVMGQNITQKIKSTTSLKLADKDK